MWLCHYITFWYKSNSLANINVAKDLDWLPHSGRLCCALPSQATHGASTECGWSLRSGLFQDSTFPHNSGRCCKGAPLKRDRPQVSNQGFSALPEERTKSQRDSQTCSSENQGRVLYYRKEPLSCWECEQSQHKALPNSVILGQNNPGIWMWAEGQRNL